MASSSHLPQAAAAAAPPPHLGTEILAHVVAAALAPWEEDEDGDRRRQHEGARELRGNLLLACRQLRDVVDAQWPEASIEVGGADSPPDAALFVGGGCHTLPNDEPQSYLSAPNLTRTLVCPDDAAAALPPPLDEVDEDCARLLGRLKSLSSLKVCTVVDRMDPWDDDVQLQSAGVVRMLLAGLPRALPDGGVRRIVSLNFNNDCISLCPSVASAVGAALPWLQHLGCPLPTADSWSGRTLGTAVLNDLPATLQSLSVTGGAVGPDGGAALARLTALTQLSLDATGLRSGICRHIAHLSGLRSLSLAQAQLQDVSDGTYSVDDTYVDGTYVDDIAALSTLGHLTHLSTGPPFVAEHLPLGHMTALQGLWACTSDLAALTAPLATPGLDGLQNLSLHQYRSLAISATHGGGQQQRPAGTGAALGDGPPLLPALRELSCVLDLRCPSFDRLPQLLRRLTHPGHLRRLHLDLLKGSPGPAGHDEAAAGAVVLANARQVLYPQLAPVLTRFTALQSLMWGLCGGHDAPPGGTFADIVRAMPRLRDVVITVGEVGDMEGGESAGSTGTRVTRRATALPQQGRAWLTDEALEALASQPDSQLQSFCLFSAAHVTLAAVKGLARLPQLRVLVVSGCPLVPPGPATTEALRRACRHPDEADIGVS